MDIELKLKTEENAEALAVPPPAQPPGVICGGRPTNGGAFAPPFTLPIHIWRLLELVGQQYVSVLDMTPTPLH